MVLRYKRLALVLLTAGFFGCNSIQTVDSDWPPHGLLGKELRSFRPPVEPVGGAAGFDAFEEPAGVITLREALASALVNNPELAAFAWGVRAAEAKTLQDGLPPNPEIEMEVEEFGGSGELSGFDASEMSLQIGQSIELGGKRLKRMRLAGLERDLAGWDYESKRVDVLTLVRREFVEVLASQERLALAQESVGLAQEIFNTVETRVSAGRVAPVEETKAKIALSAARIELRRAENELAAARNRLASTWGSSSPEFEKVEGQLRNISAPPAADQVAEIISQNPDIARWEAELEHRRASLDLEEAKRIPDLTIAGGVKRLEESDDSAFVAGFSIPLPIFDRNQGGIREARIRVAKAEEERKASGLTASVALTEAHAQLSTAFQEATSVKNEILVGSESAFEAVSEMYRQGKTNYLDVLDSQRTLVEAKARYVDALAMYHKAVADVERLIGEDLESVTKSESDESL
ncbi:MAG: TolC family protein [bacterium]